MLRNSRKPPKQIGRMRLERERQSPLGLRRRKRGFEVFGRLDRRRRAVENPVQLEVESVLKILVNIRSTTAAVPCVNPVLHGCDNGRNSNLVQLFPVPFLGSSNPPRR